MIPLRSTERVQGRSSATPVLIVLNTLVFFYQAHLGQYARYNFDNQWGIVPDHLRIVSLATSMFLHAGWIHIISNMIFLWVFGRNLEDLIGGPRFLAFYLICGLLAGVVHVIFNPYSRIATVGASGAIAGVMGAYLIKFPRARIITLVLIFVFVTTVEIPAAWLLLIWLGLQFFSGIGSLTEADYTGGGIAWFAHIGGFLGGMLLIRFFPERRKWRSWNSED